MNTEILAIIIKDLEVFYNNSKNLNLDEKIELRKIIERFQTLDNHIDKIEYIQTALLLLKLLLEGADLIKHINMNIGISIKFLRKKHALSQFELAERCGITQTALSQIENGNRRPNNETLKKLAEYFNVPEILIYLLAVEDNDVPINKKEIFQAVFPNVKNLLLSVFE